MLTAVKLRNAKPKPKPYKLADGQGLHLLVTPTGSAYWRLKYRVAGKEKVLALGVYRDAEGTEQVSLAEARDRRDDAKREMRDGKDPGAEKQSRKRATKVAQRTSFRAVAEEWVKKQRNVLDASHADSVERSLELNLYADLAKRPIAEIEAPELLAVLRKIESRGAHEIRSRVQQRASAVFRYGIANGYCQRDPAADLRGAFTPAKVTHRAALTAKELPDFFTKLGKYVDKFGGDRRTQLAVRFLMLTMVRTGELRGAEWTEFDLEAAEWRIPAERMKMGEPHVVPLSRQALAILKELKALAAGSVYVFPQKGNPLKVMSENTILFAIYRLGYHSRATGHGFRATASTILNEIGWNPDVIERQLAHQERNKVRAAYNRAMHLPERKKMMQAWADMLDEFAKPKDERKVIAGKFGAKR
jgi:integrase